MDEKDNRPYTVVVGVSATSKSPAALAWAAAQATANLRPGDRRPGLAAAQSAGHPRGHAGGPDRACR